MFHFTIFGGSEVKLSTGSKVIVTMFGGTDVYKPTLAKKIMEEKHFLDKERRWQELPAAQRRETWFGQPGKSMPRRSHTFILTVFGAAELKPPSLAEEFMDMRELVSSGMITSSEWDQLVGRLYQMGDLDSVSSFTLFGGMGGEALKEEEEIKKIRSAKELGLISEEEDEALRSVVGRETQQVRMLLRETAFS